MAYGELTAAQMENSDSDQLPTSAAAVSPISPDAYPNRSAVVKHPTMGAPGVSGVTIPGFNSSIRTPFNQLLSEHMIIYLFVSKIVILEVN